MTRDTQTGEHDAAADCRLWMEQQGRTRAKARTDKVNNRERQNASLAQLIESKVIPQMLVAHRKGMMLPIAKPSVDLHLDERVGEFADLVIKQNAASATTYFQEMLTDGATVELLFAELLGPTARRLGELWEEDINTMLDVTQGLSHLQQLVRTFSPEFTAQNGHAPASRRALLMTFPGEQHTFGIALVEQYFRRDGWHVWGGPPGTLKEVIALVGSLWFDMVGFSVTRLTAPEKLAFDLRLVREAALNRNMAVMVGGLPFVTEPGLAALVGADATAGDGAGAVAQISSMIGRPANV